LVQPMQALIQRIWMALPSDSAAWLLTHPIPAGKDSQLNE
jgi:hypothetical protein